MGKASKWIINFLLGKKEYRKRNETTLSMEFKSIKMESPQDTPKVKRKWSFRRLAGKNGSSKFSKSFDFIEDKLPLQASVEPVALHNHANAMVAIQGHIENIAATKIQAMFRSYLARKALHALRGLVKLQALVRGYIVRKQTVSTLKQMHALMSIQVRARVQRIQLTEETQLVVRSQPSTDSFAHDHSETLNLVSNSTSDHLNRAQLERINTALYFDHLSVSKPFQVEDCSLSTAENSPRSYSLTPWPNTKTASFTRREANYHEPCGHPLLPNYMINTKSSRAKVRSHSEPKQRPKWNTKQKNKQAEITDGICISLDDQRIKRSSSHCKFEASDDQDALFFELYKTERSSRSNKCDPMNNLIRYSNYEESFANFEPNFNIY